LRKTTALFGEQFEIATSIFAPRYWASVITITGNLANSSKGTDVVHWKCRPNRCSVTGLQSGMLNRGRRTRDTKTPIASKSQFGLRLATRPKAPPRGWVFLVTS